jgi:hypothetical protein
MHKIKLLTEKEMQGPTHLVCGILIQKALKNTRPLKLQYFLVASLAFLSHGVLDGLTRFTYHPYMPLFDDWFWISYHTIIAFLTIFIFIKFWGAYKIGLIFSILPDLDWVILHSCSFFSYKIPFWSEPLLHRIFYSFGNFLYAIGLNFFPDWSLEREGATLEFAVLGTLVIFTYAIGKEKERVEYIPTERRQKLLRSDWPDKLSIYVDCMDHEQSIRTAYQALLTSLEVALLSLFFFSFQLNLIGYLWIFFVLGMLLIPPFAIACEFRARNVDVWRIHIVQLVEGTDVEEAFKDAKYRWIPYGKAGFWENIFSVTGLKEY